MLKAVSSITNALGALNYKGAWNAAANTPTLASGVGTKGDYYVVGTAGTTTLDGISNWGVGDWAVFNGSVWQRVEGGADLNGVNLNVSGTSTFGDNLVVATAGKGIDFSANSNAPGMTSELLTWYEEGTFTPSAAGSTSAGTATYDFQVGKYTRIGRVVYFIVFLQWNSGTGTGNLIVTGLPFTNAGGLASYSPLAVGRISDIALTANNVMTAYVEPGSTEIRLSQYPVGGGSANQVAYDAAGTLQLSGFYMV